MKEVKLKMNDVISIEFESDNREEFVTYVLGSKTLYLAIKDYFQRNFDLDED